MNIEIYINRRLLSEYSEAELKTIKQEITQTAMTAAGFTKTKD